MEPSSEEDLDTALIQKDNLERLKAIWPTLSSEDRLLLERKYLAGDSDADIAQALGCKPSSVRMKLTRARRCAIKLLQGGILDERL
jgi:RNA polymerase sigma-70 factor (ECF subfamily)